MLICIGGGMRDSLFIVCKFNTFFREECELRNKNVICLLIFVDRSIKLGVFLLISLSFRISKLPHSYNFAVDYIF